MENLVTTLNALGTLLIAWAALSVHHRVLNEHKIDSKVFRVMRIEQGLGVAGMVMVIVAYILGFYL